MYYANEAREWLSDTFGNRGTGQREGFGWPTRSAGLSPCGFFPSGVIKEAVYSTKPRSLEELKKIITNTFYSITPELVTKCECRWRTEF